MLIHAADMILKGASTEEAATYLARIVADDMGLGPVGGQGVLASLRTAEAISAHLRELPKD